MGTIVKKSHMIRVPFGIKILCCLQYIVMVNIVGEPKSQKEEVGAGLAWETKLDRDCNSTVVACEASLVRFYGLYTDEAVYNSRISAV